MDQETKRKRGRPEGYRAENPLNERLAVNITSEQLKRYKQIANKEKKSLSKWVRDCLDRCAMSGSNRHKEAD